MGTIQMTLDDDLVKAVDRVSKKLCTTRSAFARKALSDALVRSNSDTGFRIEIFQNKHPWLFFMWDQYDREVLF